MGLATTPANRSDAEIESKVDDEVHHGDHCREQATRTL